MRQTTFIPLEEVKIASPCHADWDKMQGDERTRFCQSCAKNVYNLSEMSRPAAEALLTEKEGQLCVRYFQRADGTVITDDCPIAIKMVRRPLRWMAGVAAAILASGLPVVRGQANPPATKPATPSVPMPLTGLVARPTHRAPVALPKGKGKKAGKTKHSAKKSVKSQLRLGRPAMLGAPTPPPLMGEVQAIMGDIAAAPTATPQPLMGKPMMPRDNR